VRQRLIVFFAVVQVVGMVCAWLQHPPSAASPLLWGTGFVLLFPGDLLSAWIMEKLFWQSGLPLASMTAITTVLMAAINAIVWFLAVKAMGTIRARLFAHSGSPTRS
jgi:hypothetical protein